MTYRNTTNASIILVMLALHAHALTNTADRAPDTEAQPSENPDAGTIFDQDTATSASDAGPIPVSSKKLDLTPVLQSLPTTASKPYRDRPFDPDRYILSFKPKPTEPNVTTYSPAVRVGNGFTKLFFEDFTFPTRPGFTLFDTPIDVHGLTPPQTPASISEPADAYDASSVRATLLDD